MSNTTEFLKAKSTAAPAAAAVPPRAEVGPMAPGRDILVEALEREGV